MPQHQSPLAQGLLSYPQKNDFLSLSIFSLLCFLSGVTLHQISPLNQALFSYLNHITPASMLPAWYLLTTLADGVFALSLFTVISTLHQRMVMHACISFLLSTLLIQGLKHGLSVPRPLALSTFTEFQQYGEVLTQNAMPSGHTATAFVSITLLYLYRNVRRYENTYKILLLTSAITLGLSRVMIGAHWPADVLVGACVGIFSALLPIWLIHKIQLKSSIHNLLNFLLILLNSSVLLLHEYAHALAYWLLFPIQSIAFSYFLIQLYKTKKKPHQ